MQKIYRQLQCQPHLILIIIFSQHKIVNIYTTRFSRIHNLIASLFFINIKLNPLIKINYDIHFPLYWIFDEKTYYDDEAEPQLTGPIHCNYCILYGHYKGVFIGYCGRCADLFYSSRGCGFLITPDQEPGKEIKTYLKTTYEGVMILNHNKEDSMWETYLKGVTLSEIGDDQLEEEFELYKDLPDLIPIAQEFEIQLDDLENGNIKPIRVLTKEEEEEYGMEDSLVI